MLVFYSWPTLIGFMLLTTVVSVFGIIVRFYLDFMFSWTIYIKILIGAGLPRLSWEKRPLSKCLSLLYG